MKFSRVVSLLARLLEWTEGELTEERSRLEILSQLKYDEYQQFSAGDRFAESLVRWLYQLETLDERRTAYDYIRGSLVFFSRAEIGHLVSMAYRHGIRPELLSAAAKHLRGSPYKVGGLSREAPFLSREARTLFVALSDGSRIDQFRRANPDLSHEQIVQSYEVSQEKSEGLLKKLRERTGDKDAHFCNVVLLDDFSASGTSYFSGDGKKGKIAKFLAGLTTDENPTRTLFGDDLSQTLVVVTLYIATAAARRHIEKGLRQALEYQSLNHKLLVIQELPDSCRVDRSAADRVPFQDVLEHYYDDSIFDSHMQKGGAVDGRYGYADGGLSVILHHNTPNNSVAILWSYDHCDVRGLFPRVRRHKDFE